MTYQAKLLILTYFLIFCRASDSRKGKNPVKRSGIAIPSIMDDLILEKQSDIGSSKSFNSMFLPNVDDSNLRYLDLVKLLRQHQKQPKPESRRIQTTQFTEALVDITACSELMNSDCKLQVRGKFGHHSPHRTVSGRLIHVRSIKHGDLYDGCSKDLANVRRNMDPWIALISRGNCSFTKKIKLAEKYNASAVIIYNTVNSTDIEVMRTAGTRIPSLSVNSSDGQKLVKLTRKPAPVMTKISAGRINILTSKPIPEGRSLPTNATIHFQSKQNGSPPRTINDITSVFGYHSPSRPVSGKLIHVRDFDSDDTHFGCFGKISNEDELSVIEGAWVALIARGRCDDLVKVKLAEKYHASAVIIYNRNYIEQEKPLYIFSAQIPTIALGVSDGRESLNLLESEKENLFVEILIDKIQSPKSKRTIQASPPRNGDGNNVLRSPQTVIFHVIIINIMFLILR